VSEAELEHEEEKGIIRLYRADGSPRPVGVIGYPIKHSLSPIFQNVAFAEHGLPHRYEKLEVSETDLPAFLEQARRDDYLGLNATLPHKQALMQAANGYSEEAHIAGAANTLLLDDEHGWLAHNTDVGGFQEALDSIGYSPLKQRTMVIGAGGAARAVVMALGGAGAVEIAVVNRNFERAAQLVAEVGSYFSQCNIYAAPLDPAAWPFNRNPRTLVVNATSQGILEPDAEFPIDPDHLAGRDADRRTVFFDLTYGDTPFLRSVRDRAAQVLDGLPMLVYQGALAFEWWTGLTAPREKMLAAVREQRATNSEQ
jgi:shikimate dehydrogenase